MRTTFQVVKGDVTCVPSDVLLLKHAAAFYGIDEVVANLLTAAKMTSIDRLNVAADQAVIVDSGGALTASKVLFVGTPALFEFGYSEMRQFARRAIEVLSQSRVDVTRLTTTVHGAGYGLDVEEALSQLVLGFQDGLQAAIRFGIDEIIFVDRESRRVDLLTNALNKLLAASSDGPVLQESGDSRAPIPASDQTALPRSETNETFRTEAVLSPVKKHVFVAMPFSEDFEDIYEYGIYAPVRKCGLICEKTSESSFTGDILQRIRERIETADLVIAELTGGRPNVYLEVGYAWGKDVPVVLLAKHGEVLHFDVSRHRCLYYKSIRQLAQDLEKLIRGLFT